MSAYDLACSAVSAALARLPDEASLDLRAFGAEVRALGKGKYVAARAKGVDDARAFLKEKAGEGRGRELARALREALEQEPPPDEVYLFTAGLPDVRDPLALASALADLAWTSGTRIFGIGVQLPEKTTAESEREKLERRRAAADFSVFLASLATGTGGRFVVTAGVQADATPGAQPVAGTKPGAADAGGKFAIKLDAKGKVAHDEHGRVKKRFDEALAGKDPQARDVIAAVCACSDDGVFELARKALLATDPEVLDAAVAGFADNQDPKHRKAIQDELHAERDATKAMGLVRALAAQKGALAAWALAQEAATREGSGDVARVLLAELARRPQEDLAAIGSSIDLAKIGRGRTGSAGRHAARVLARLEGKPDDAALDAANDRFLPEKFAKGASVAVVLDAEREAMERLFFTPAPAPRGAPPTKEPPPTPITRFEAARREVLRAIEALALAEARANVILMGEGASLGPKVAALPHLGAKAKEFVVGARTEPARDPLKALEKALEDQDVEEIHVLAAGLPLRSGSDAEAVHRRLRQLQRARRVPVHVVLVLGPVEPGRDAERAAAERKDEATRLEAFWGPIAREAGGAFAVKERLRGLEATKPAAPGPKPGGR